MRFITVGYRHTDVPDPEERAARAAARTAQAGLRRKGARGATASAIRQEGAWVVRIEVPVGAVDKIVRPRG